MVTALRLCACRSRSHGRRRRVAIVLQIAEALYGASTNPVIFTVRWKSGTPRAQAFTAYHPWAEDVGW